MKALLLLLLLLNPNWSVRPAPEYDELFNRREGWTGADGTYSLPYGCGVFWLFSDTFWGALDAHGRRLPGWKFLHNSLAVQHRGRPLAFQGPVFTPPDGKGWFWVYSGRVLPDKAEILLGQFDTTQTGEPGWNFAQIGNWVADLNTETWTASNYRRLKWFKAPDSYGASLLTEGEWTYVYGTRDLHTTRSLLLARCRSLDGPWEFYGELAPDVSNELSVHRTRRGDYLLVSQSGPHIQVRRAPQPWGPFGPAETVYTVPEHRGSVFTYNAKAHPELSTKDLLVSYNVNASPQEVERDGTIYRPRFLWLQGDW